MPANVFWRRVPNTKEIVVPLDEQAYGRNTDPQAALEELTDEELVAYPFGPPDWWAELRAR